MHPKAALLALQGLMPYRIPRNAENVRWRFFAAFPAANSFTDAGDDVAAITLMRTTSRFGPITESTPLIMESSVIGATRPFMPGTWEDASDADWDSLTQKVIDEFLELENDHAR